MIAIIADIHGNHLALEAVLRDLKRRGGADRIVNLGDCVSGPLWPRETAECLARLGALTVRGNHDRRVGTCQRSNLVASDAFAFDALLPDQRQWLAALPTVLSVTDNIVALHGTPEDDEAYLVERVLDGGLCADAPAAIAHRLGPTAGRIILCGHSHRADIVRLPDGRVIVNPGSVGCPAYRDPTGVPHVSESGSPFARYALLDLTAAEPAIAFLAVPYDCEAAARKAEENGRADWAGALRTGSMRV